MTNPPRVMLLIDADNVSTDVIEQAISRLHAEYGALHVRRAYGTAEAAVKHQNLFKRLSIKPMVNLAAGKNSTDIALAVDAIDLVLSERPDVVVIASSDSDFAPLVSRIREKGCLVRGIGQKGKVGEETPLIYDDFLVFEHHTSRRHAGQAGEGAAPGARKTRSRRSPASPAASKEATPTAAGKTPAPKRSSARGKSGRGTSRRGAGPDAAANANADANADAMAEAAERAAVEAAAEAAAEASVAAAHAEPDVDAPPPAVAEPAVPVRRARKTRAGARASTVGPATADAPGSETGPEPAPPPAPPAKKPARKSGARKSAGAARTSAAATEPAPVPAAETSTESFAETSAEPPSAPAPAPHLPEKVARAFEVLPALAAGERLDVQNAAAVLRKERVFSNADSWPKFFHRYRDWFELTPPGRPTHVQRRAPH